MPEYERGRTLVILLGVAGVKEWLGGEGWRVRGLMRPGRSWIRGGLNMVWTSESKGFFFVAFYVFAGVAAGVEFLTIEEALENFMNTPCLFVLTNLMVIGLSGKYGPTRLLTSHSCSADDEVRGLRIYCHELLT